MRSNLLFLLFFVATIQLYAQNIKRIEIAGKIVVASDELENVTIYNTSSNKGTLTDEKGQFKINVALNDILEIRALQFQDFTVTIDQSILNSKKVTIFLVEKINKLNEVVILPYDLTGNLMADMESVRTFNPDLDAIYFGIGDITAYDFPEDYKSEVENVAARGPNDIRYQMDGIAMIGMLLKPLFKSKNRQKTDAVIADDQTNSLRNYYTTHYITENFNIPEDKVDEFISYVEDSGLDYSLLKKGKEMEFLEFLTLKSKQFLNSEGVKD